MSKIYFLTKSGLLMDNYDIANAQYIIGGKWVNPDNFDQVREIAKTCEGIEKEIKPSVKKLIKDGNRAMAIIIYRDRHPGIGLVEAKDAVDKITEKMKERGEIK